VAKTVLADARRLDCTRSTTAGCTTTAIMAVIEAIARDGTGCRSDEPLVVEPARRDDRLHGGGTSARADRDL